MSILDDLNRLSSAEDFFETLDVPYDPAIVRVSRLHILRRMGQYLKGEDFTGLDDQAVRAACRSCLAAAYQDFVGSSPIEQRVFKVHQDAVKPKNAKESAKPFVPLSALGVVG